MQPVRQMPSSPDAEKQVLGWLLNGQTDAHDVLSVLRAEDFHDRKHQHQLNLNPSDSDKPEI